MKPMYFFLKRQKSSVRGEAKHSVYHSWEKITKGWGLTEHVPLEVISLGDFVSQANHLCMNGNTVFSGTLRGARKR